jgi:hypothetical protein
MAKRDKLLQKARNAPRSLGFEELCALAESYGFVLARQTGSHRIYKHRSGRMMNFQRSGRS